VWSYTKYDIYHNCACGYTLWNRIYQYSNSQWCLFLPYSPWSELILGCGLHVSIGPLGLNFMWLFEIPWDIWSTKMKWFANSGSLVVLQINISYFRWINSPFVWLLSLGLQGPMTCFLVGSYSVWAHHWRRAQS